MAHAHVPSSPLSEIKCLQLHYFHLDLSASFSHWGNLRGAVQLLVGQKSYCDLGVSNHVPQRTYPCSTPAGLPSAEGALAVKEGMFGSLWAQN